MDHSHRPHTPFGLHMLGFTLPLLACRCNRRSFRFNQHITKPQLMSWGVWHPQGKRPENTISVSSRNHLEVLGLGCATTTSIGRDRRVFFQTGRPVEALQKQVQHLTWCCMCVPAQQAADACAEAFMSPHTMLPLQMPGSPKFWQHAACPVLQAAVLLRSRSGARPAAPNRRCRAEAGRQVSCTVPNT